MKKKSLIFIAIFILAIAIINVCCLELAMYFSFEKLSNQRAMIKQFVDTHQIAAPLLFILFYAASTALSIPGGAFYSIFAGFLFPQPFSTLYVITGATLGATLLFLAARGLFRGLLKNRIAPYLQKFQKGFDENEASYMLFLRLVPLFPFWLVNLAPAFLNVRLRTFIWTTAVGVIPGAFVFTQAGYGLGEVFDAESISIETIFNRNIQIALIALGFFALIPVIIKRMRKRK